MKRGTTRTLNKRLQKIEERLRGPVVHPIKITLVDSYKLCEGAVPDKVYELLINSETGTITRIE